MKKIVIALLVVCGLIGCCSKDVVGQGAADPNTRMVKYNIAEDQSLQSYHDAYNNTTCYYIVNSNINYRDYAIRTLSCVKDKEDHD